MTDDTQNFIAELEQRVSELSTALEIVTESRDLLRKEWQNAELKITDLEARLSKAHTLTGRLTLLCQQGVEL